MPFYNNKEVDDSFNRNCIGTEYKFALVPVRCHKSGKIIWFEKAYRRVAMWTGPGDPAFAYRWYKKDEYIFAKLNGTL